MPPRNKSEKPVYEGTSVGSTLAEPPKPSTLENLVEHSVEIRASAESINSRVWRLLSDVNADDIPPRDSCNETECVRKSLLPRLGDRLDDIEGLLGDIEEGLRLLEQNLKDHCA